MSSYAAAVDVERAVRPGASTPASRSPRSSPTEVVRAARPVRRSRRAACPRARSATRPGWRSRSACSAGTPIPRRRRTRSPTRCAPSAKSSCRCANAWYARRPAVLPVQRVGHVEPERVRRRVGRAELGAEPERVARRPRPRRAAQLRAEVADQQPRRDDRPVPARRGVPHGAQQFRLGDRAGVVQVQRVAAGRVALGDVGRAPTAPRRPRSGAQLRCAARRAARRRARSRPRPRACRCFHSVPG